MTHQPTFSRQQARIGAWMLFFAALGLLGIAFVDSTAPAAQDAKTVKVGILHSLTGSLAIEETNLKNAELLAIDEINAKGGILGRKMEPIIEDGKSEFITTIPDKAKKLIEQDKVAVIFGCYVSVARKNVLPVLEKNNALLFYPANYEGSECSKNVIYTGAVPNQQVLPAIKWMLEEKKYKKIYLIGTDYVYPRTANFIIRKYLQTKKLDPVAEKYVPFGHPDFADIVKAIKQKRPEVIVSMINGDSNISFFNELAAQGITPEKTPVVSFFLGEEVLLGLDPQKLKGHYTAACYFQSLDTPKNKEFVKNFKAKYGKDRVTNDGMAAAYAQVYLWKLAVEQAKSFDVDKVRAALRTGIVFDAPEGRIGIDAKTQHTSRYFRMGRMREDRQFDIVYQTKEWIAPDPFPQVAFPGWSCDWTKDGLIKGPPIRTAP